MNYRKVYKQALEDAIVLMENDEEVTSSLKQAASDHGIPWGREMEKFVKWAYRQLRIAGDSTMDREAVASELVAVARELSAGPADFDRHLKLTVEDYLKGAWKKFSGNVRMQAWDFGERFGDDADAMNAFYHRAMAKIADIARAERRAVIARDRKAAKWAVDLVAEIEDALDTFYMEVGPALDRNDFRKLKMVERHVGSIRGSVNALMKIMDRADI